MILGGDVAGKAIQSIVRGPDGRWSCTFIGTDYEVDDGPELDALEKLIADHGYYPYRAEPGELEARQAAGTLDDLFLELMQARLTEWLDLADERLRPQRQALYVHARQRRSAGARRSSSTGAPWGDARRGQDRLARRRPRDDQLGLLEPDAVGQLPRAGRARTLEASLAKMAAGLSHPERAVVNAPRPAVRHAARRRAGARREPQGPGRSWARSRWRRSAARRSATFRARDASRCSGLHGHIHEASGIRRLGRTIAINPGSDYSTGTLNGALITLEKDKVAAHQLVRG